MSAAATDSADRLTFWRNWYTASRQLPDELRLAWLDAVLDFAFEGREPSPAADDMSGVNGIAAAIGFQAVQMVRATIEISRKRKESGSKGGVKKKRAESKAQAKRKQNASKTKANRNQVQEQVQEQEQEQEHNANSYSATQKKPPTIAQFVSGGKVAGVPEDFARSFYADLVAAGWQDKDGRYVANWRRYLKSAYLDQKKIPAARGERKELTLADIPDVR